MVRLAAQLVLVAALGVACQSPAPTGTPVSAAGLRLVAPPGWTARLAAPADAGGTTPLGWATNQVPVATCAGACRQPIAQLEPGGMVVWIRRLSCLPNCRLPDGGRTLIGNREAVRQDVAAQVCGTLGDGPGNPVAAEAIVVSVTPQRQDVFLVCSRAGADAARAGLDRLLASASWTIP